MSILSQMGLPAQERRASHHRSQGLGYRHGYALHNDEAPGIGGEELVSSRILKERDEQLMIPTETFNPALTYGILKRPDPAPAIPPAVAYDKVVLRFDCYFLESVHESSDETYRVRKCLLEYFPDDDSILITENLVDNSGMPQGKLIKRQKVPKNESENYLLPDLYCGAELNIYGKVFRIVKCDEFTAKFMASKGIDYGTPEELPFDAYTDKRKRMAHHERGQLFDPAKLAMRKFLANDRKVLRFYGLWDDRQSLYGEIHRMVIRFFLVDDTIEIRELVSPNSGIIPYYLRRIKLPKYFNDLNDMKTSPYYTDEDFEIGGIINAFGRPIEIHDCDEFTRTYYSNMGREMRPMTEYKWESPGGETSTELPPYNGFGNEEDTVGNCLLLMPKPPRKDLIRMITHDHKVLRFLSRINTNTPEDKDRRFIVSYYLADDTIGVFEPIKKNSGILCGKFLDRRKMKHSSENRYIGTQDFYVGAILRVVGQSFILMQADEYTLHYMEQNSVQFPHSDIQRVIETIKSSPKPKSMLLDAFKKLDPLGTGRVSYDDLRTALRVTSPQIVDQDVVTLARRFDTEGKGYVPYDEIISYL